MGERKAKILAHVNCLDWLLSAGEWDTSVESRLMGKMRAVGLSLSGERKLIRMCFERGWRGGASVIW